MSLLTDGMAIRNRASFIMLDKEKWLLQYQSREWQILRLRIFARDSFTCTRCENKEGQLHLHHKVYLTDIPVFLHPDHLLVTLCERCHTENHKDKTAGKECLDALKIHGFLSSDLRVIANTIKGITEIDTSNHPPIVISHLIANILVNKEVQELALEAYLSHLKSKIDGEAIHGH